MFRFGLGSSHSFDYVNASRQSRMDSRPRVPKSGQVTPRLPNEIFQRVIQQLADADAKGSLASILVTSRAAYDAVAPTLYKEVILTRKGADSFYRGLNPGLPRVQQPKREKTITWDQFIKADKHVQDQHRKKRDKHMKGGGGKRKLHAVWPHVDIDSDNEDDEDEDDEDEDDDTAYDYKSLWTERDGCLPLFNASMSKISLHYTSAKISPAFDDNPNYRPCLRSKVSRSAL